VGVHDSLREPCRARRVVELRGIVGRRLSRREVGGVPGEEVGRERDDGYAVLAEARRIRLVRDEHGGLRVAEPVRDSVIPVQDRHREKQGADLPRPEEDRRRFRRGRQDDGDSIAGSDSL
jgi:hypothetical protein